MYHSDPTFNRVMTVFVEQGNRGLTPAFFAYELDMTSRAAEALLDEMVKHSLLDIDFDDNGQLYYSLSQDAIFDIELRQQQEQQAPYPDEPAAYEPATHEPSNDWGQPQGFDGTVGQGGWAPTPQPAGRQPRRPAPVGPDGCDGTVGHPGDVRQPADLWADGPAPVQQPSTAHRPAGDQQMVRYDDENLPARPRRSADPMIAALLSVLLVGTGQIYNREVGKGVAMFISWTVLWMFSMGWIVNLWAVVDAYGVAARNRHDSSRDPSRELT